MTDTPIDTPEEDVLDLDNLEGVIQHETREDLAAEWAQIEPGKPYELDLRAWWYEREGRKRHPVQERFLFDPHTEEGCPFIQGLLGGRGLGKTEAFARKHLILALLNASGDPAHPVWGMLFGRNNREIVNKLLPPLISICAEIKRELGIDWIPRHVKGSGLLHFPFGASIYLLSYSDEAQLADARGYNAAWAGLDETEFASVPHHTILDTVTPALRDPRAKHKCLFWTSSPNGLKGFVKAHHDAIERGDTTYWLTTGTSWDNPYADLASIKHRAKALSKRLFCQEYLGVVLQPSNVVFQEYQEAIHVVPYRWQPHDKTIISVDWGTTHAYVCAIKVDSDGNWVVAKEHKAFETSETRFRNIVQDFWDEVVRLDRGKAPYMATCDPMPKEQSGWLSNKFGPATEAGVRKLTTTKERGVAWGLHLIASLLEPRSGPPKLYISDALTASTDDAKMGIRGAFASYTFAQRRDERGGLFTIDEPSKRNNADHPIDCLRYAVCLSRNMEELHGGRRLAHIDPEQY